MKNKIIKYLLYVLIIILIFLYNLYFNVYRYFNINSDIIAPILMMEDILNGNLLLKGWVGSTSNFIVGLYQSGLIPYSIFGLTKEYILIYMTVVVTGIMITAYIITSKYSKDKIVSIILFFCLIIMLPSSGISSLYAYSHHAETYLFILINLIIIRKILYSDIDIKKTIKYGILMYIVSFSMYSDSITMYVYLIPLFIIFIYNILWYEKKYKIYIITAVILLGIITNKLIQYFVKVMGGIYHTNYRNATAISDIDVWPERFIKSLNMLASSFNIKTFHNIFDYIGLLLLIVLVVYAIYVLLNPKKYDIIKQFLALSPLLFFAANVTANIPISDRYFVPQVLFLLILLATSNPLYYLKTKVKNKKVYVVAVGLLIIICILNVYRNANFNIRDLSIYYNIKTEISDIVQKHDLKNGYGTFWNAAEFSFYAGTDTIVAPIILSHNNYIPYKWLSKNDWYKITRYINFIVASENEIEEYYEIFGKPDYIYNIKLWSNRYILIYNKKINDLPTVNPYQKVSIDEGYYSDGWSYSERVHRWSIGNESIITLPVNNNGKDIVLNINLIPYLNDKIKEQYVKFIVADKVLKEEKMDNTFRLYKINIPNEYIKDSILELKIELQNPVSSPAAVGGGDGRRLGVSLTELYFELQ